MVNSPTKKKSKTEPSPPPDMSALHAPVAKGWGKTEWAQWSNGVDAHIDQLPHDKFEAIIEARNEAVQWAAPEEITVEISIEEEEVIDENEESVAATAPKKNDGEKTAASAAVSSSSDGTKRGGMATSSSSKIYTKSHEIVLSKQGNDTFRSILDTYCQEKNIERDNYRWSHKDSLPIPRVDTLLNETDVKCFFEFWHCHPPTLASRFVDENTFLPEIVGRRKTPPGSKPSVASSFEHLKKMPPHGNAGSEEWDKWHRENPGGCMQVWMERSKAIQYSCPDEIDIVLKRLSHEHTVRVNAWEPLSVALSSYCVSTTGTDFAVTPSEAILRSYNDPPIYIDAQETSPRMRFNGYLPLKMEVVYRDTCRTKAEFESTRGPVPDGYREFLGSGYRLSDTEQSWLVTQEHGIAMYNKYDYRGYEPFSKALPLIN